MVLPPFVGDDPGMKASMSPYDVTMLALVERFATSIERVAILRGLLSYRRALFQIGLVDGYQWLDGSFVEDVEASRKRAPKDIDLVTFASSPADATERMTWFRANTNLFDARKTKQAFMCDAYFVDFRKRADLLVDDARYWFGLFSHQRGTTLWKGMLKVPMLSDEAGDDPALTLLNMLATNLEADNAQET